MIYEVRTYTLRTGAVPEFEDRFAKRKPLREKHSKLGAFWHTDFGPLNQVIHAWPYADLAERTRVREAMAQDAERPDRRAAVRHHDPRALHAAAGQPQLRHRQLLRDADLYLRAR
jgi:hypothetical protein